jgi:hypothetical protein
VTEVHRWAVVQLLWRALYWKLTRNRSLNPKTHPKQCHWKKERYREKGRDREIDRHFVTAYYQDWQSQVNHFASVRVPNIPSTSRSRLCLRCMNVVPKLEWCVAFFLRGSSINLHISCSKRLQKGSLFSPSFGWCAEIKTRKSQSHVLFTLPMSQGIILRWKL